VSDTRPDRAGRRARFSSSPGRLDSDLTLDVRRSVNVEVHLAWNGTAERGAAGDATPHQTLMGAGPAAVESFAQDPSDGHRRGQRLDERLVPGGDIHMHFGHRPETIRPRPGVPAPPPMLSTSDVQTIATRLSCPYLTVTTCSTPDVDHPTIGCRSAR